jgi:hypothetical protein
LDLRDLDTFENAPSKCIYPPSLFVAPIVLVFTTEYRMLNRRLSALVLFPGLLTLSGCAQKYTRHMSETYKESKIGETTIGVVALPELSYTPPSSCMGGGDGGKGPKYQAEWNEGLMKSLAAAFKKQKFISIPVARLDEIGIDAPSFFSLADAGIEKMGVHQYEAQGGELQPVDYQPSRSDGKMKIWLNKLKEKDSVDFVIALVDPKMTGETHTSYNAPVMGPNGAMMGGGSSSVTVYTSDARFGVWSTETGELAYASGSIAASSGFCFFMSPQSASINGNNSDMGEQLKALITAFLRRMPESRVELGRADLVR